MIGTDDKLAHGERLRGGSSYHVGRARIDENFVSMDGAINVVFHSMKCEIELFLRGLLLDRFLVVSHSVNIDSQCFTE